MRPLPKNEGPNIPIGFRMPEALAKRVDAIAESTGHTPSFVMIHFIREGVEAHERREAGDAEEAPLSLSRRRTDDAPAGAKKTPPKR